MSEVNGTWKIEVNTPLGKQNAEVNVEADGDTFNGSIAITQGSSPITDGQVDGNKLNWSVNITQPMPMTLEFAVEVNGNDMTGFVKLGMFGRLCRKRYPSLVELVRTGDVPSAQNHTNSLRDERWVFQHRSDNDGCRRFDYYFHHLKHETQSAVD